MIVDCIGFWFISLYIMEKINKLLLRDWSYKIKLAEYPCFATGEEIYAPWLDASALPPLSAVPIGTHLPNPYDAITTSHHFDKAFASMGSDKSP
jgi:hypothetical protein